jgi:hypothetical protein
VGRLALYKDETRPLPRAEVVLEPGVLTLTMPGGDVRAIGLDGCAAMTADAASRRRFVRMLIVDHADARLVIITPPDRGSIAPRAIRLPEAPPDAAVIENAAWDALVDWLMSGGRLTACSVAELARLVQIASPQFATIIGEVAARVALETVWESAGPWRGGVDLDHALRPLVDAARYSVRAAEALVAAHAVASVLRPRRRRAG